MENKKMLTFAKLVIVFSFLICGTIFSTACNNSENHIEVTSVSLSEETISLGVGESETLTATVLPINATDKSITWTSSDQSIATIVDGKVTAVGNGTVTITAKSHNGKAANCTVNANVYPYADFSFSFSNNEYAITGYSGTDTEIIVPAEYMGKPVTKIGELVFSDCSFITKITLPDSINEIGDGAFGGCNNLESVVIPDSITSIGDYTFSGCLSLTSISVHENLTSIGDFAFYFCYNLASIIIPDSVTNIGEFAFDGCSALIIYCEAASKPNSWNNNWNSNWNSNCIVVWDCYNNEIADDGAIYTIIDNIRYALKDGEATIVKQPIAISGNFVIPKIVTYKEQNYDIKYIGDNAFDGCSSLTSIVIPDNITSIGKNAFSGCSNLMSIVIPDSITSIGDEAFSSCSSLASIFIPDSVTNIGNYLFANCGNITIYCEAASKPNGWSRFWNIEDCPVVWGYKNT